MRSASRLLVLITAAVLFGCSGETMSAEEYFAELDVIAQTTDDALSNWEQETSDALRSATSDEGAAEVFLPLLEDAGVIVQTALTQLEELSPPDSVADAHAAFVSSIRASLSAFQGLVNDYNTLGFEGVLAAVQGEELQGLEQAQDEACADLQTIADDSGFDVDLECGE